MTEGLAPGAEPGMRMIAGPNDAGKATGI
jgi:hypothetical protein